MKNSNLFGPALIQKHFLAKGVQQISTQKLEHCYYHARTPQDTRPAAIGAFRTCNGLSGIIHVNNESFVIHPFYDADLSVSIPSLVANFIRRVHLSNTLHLTTNPNHQQKKHPHIIYRYQPQQQTASSAEANQVDDNDNGDGGVVGQPESVRRRECGNSRLHEWALRQYNANPNNGFNSSSSSQTPASPSLLTGSSQDQNHFTSLLEAATSSLSNDEQFLSSEFNARKPRATDKTSHTCDSNTDHSAECRQKLDQERLIRDVSLTEKYIELALVLSQDMFDKRNASQASASSRLAVLHDAIQIINCLDLYFSSANTRVSLIYIETWAFGDQIDISHDARQTLYNFLEYSTRKLYKVSMDAAHLLTGGHLRQFDYNEIGMSVPDSVCTSRAVSVSQEPSVFEPFLAASTMAHMLGHNLGMEHDTVHHPNRYLQRPHEQVSSVSSVAPIAQNNSSSSSSSSSTVPSVLVQSTSSKRPTVAMHGLDEEPEDEIKSRSVDSNEEMPQFEAGDGECRANCLMSDHFVHLQPPVSFASLVRKQANSSTLLTALNVSQDFTSNTSGDDEPVDQLSIVDQSESATPDDLDGEGAPTQQQGQNQRQRPIFTSATLPFRFSRKSIETYRKLLRLGQAICLLNKPNQLEDFKTCGNGIVDRGEDCDCGSFHECSMSDSCCDPITCRFRADAECIEGACCDRCHLRPRGHVCRRARGECDLAEVCDGKSGQCQPDVHKQNGHPCAGNTGYCYLGQCPTHDAQCSELWGQEARRSDKLCYSSFNINGTIRGNCGTNLQPAASSSSSSSASASASASSSHSYHERNSNNRLHSSTGYKRCEQEHMMCGTLQCQLGDMKPVTASLGATQATSSTQVAASEYSKKVVHSLDGQHHECKVIIGSSSASSISYVRDGSKCANNKVCLNQTCQPLKVAYRDSYELCPHDERGRRCSGNGICSTANRCHCDSGWQGHDCSQRWAPSTALPPYTETITHLSNKLTTIKLSQDQLLAAAELNLSTISTTSTQSSRISTALTSNEQVTTTTTTTPAPTEVPVAPVPNTSSSSSDKPPAIKDSARPLVFILVCVVAAVFVGFALMANCYRRKGFLKPDKVLRHHQMNCKLDAIRSSFIAKRLADAAGGVVPLPGLSGDDDLTGGPPLLDLMHHHQGPTANTYPMQVSADFIQPHPSTSSNHLMQSQPPLNYYGLTTSQYGPPGQQHSSTLINQRQRQFPATVHYQHEQSLDGPLGYRQRSANMDSFEAYDAQGEATGDHVPLLMNSSMEPQAGHHTIRRGPGTLRSFGGAKLPQNAGHYSGQRDQIRKICTSKLGGTSSGTNPMNRTSSLGNVNKQCQHNSQRWQRARPNNNSSGRLEECCSREVLDDDDTLAAHRVLATPSRATSTLGCTASCWQPHRSSRHHLSSGGQHHLDLDSCSAPSSPERHASEWSDTMEHHAGNSRNRTGAEHKLMGSSSRRPPSRQSVMSSSAARVGANSNHQQNDGYHEDYVLGALSSSQQRHRQQTFANSTSNSFKQRSHQVDDDAPHLPAPPPPPHTHLFADQDSNADDNEIVSDDNQRDSDYYTNHPHSGSKQSAARSNISSSNWPNVRTVHRVPLNDGVTGPPFDANATAANGDEQSNLTLIAQLQQLAHVRSMHQKQVAAGRTSTGSGSNQVAAAEPANDLHEFFSLPLSVQLSALLARSLRNENSLPQVSTPIDDYLNNLNNSSVATSSRRSFKKTQNASGNTNNQQTMGQSQRQQAKLQNLQELINRLQKLHSQTMIQQQRLNDLDYGELDEDEVGDKAALTGHKRRPTRLVTKSKQLIRSPASTVDDMFVPAPGDGAPTSDGKWIEGSSQSLGRAPRGHRKHSAGSSLAARTSVVHESVYSMSDSEDGVFVARMLINQERQVRKGGGQRIDVNDDQRTNEPKDNENLSQENSKKVSCDQAVSQMQQIMTDSQKPADPEANPSNSASPQTSSAAVTDPQSASSQMSTFKP